MANRYFKTFYVSEMEYCTCSYNVLLKYTTALCYLILRSIISGTTAFFKSQYLALLISKPIAILLKRLKRSVYYPYNLAFLSSKGLRIILRSPPNQISAFLICSNEGREGDHFIKKWLLPLLRSIIPVNNTLRRSSLVAQALLH